MRLFHSYFPRYHDLDQELKINNLLCQTYSWNKGGLNLFSFGEYGNWHIIKPQAFTSFIPCNKCNIIKVKHCPIKHPDYFFKYKISVRFPFII